MDNWLPFLMNLCAWIAFLVVWLLLRKYLPTYFQEKGKNLLCRSFELTHLCS